MCVCKGTFVWYIVSSLSRAGGGGGVPQRSLCMQLALVARGWRCVLGLPALLLLPLPPQWTPSPPGLTSSSCSSPPSLHACASADCTTTLTFSSAVRHSVDASADRGDAGRTPPTTPPPLLLAAAAEEETQAPMAAATVCWGQLSSRSFSTSGRGLTEAKRPCCCCCSWVATGAGRPWLWC